MIAQEYINHLLPSVKKGDYTEKAFDWMDEFNVRHLPVVEDGVYYGLISESDLFGLEFAQNTPYQEHQDLESKDFYVSAEMHIYEVLKLVGESEQDIIPVLSSDQEYLGTIIVKDLVRAVSEIFTSQVPGAIIVLKVDAIHYSLAEISRLIEADSARILSTYVRHLEDDPKVMLVTIKLNIENISHILATLERFDYNIYAQFSTEDLDESSTERLQMLLKYLEI